MKYLLLQGNVDKNRNVHALFVEIITFDEELRQKIDKNLKSFGKKDVDFGTKLTILRQRHKQASAEQRNVD